MNPQAAELGELMYCAVADLWVRGQGSDLGVAPSPDNEPDGIPEVILSLPNSVAIVGVDGVILHQEQLDHNRGSLRVGPGVRVGFVGTWDSEEEELLAAPDGAPLETTLTQSLEPGRSTWVSVTYSAENNGKAVPPERIRVSADVERSTSLAP